MQITLGSFENTLASVQQDVTTYWTGLTAAINESSAVIAKGALAEAAEAEALAQRMLNLASDYSTNLMNATRHGTLTPAEQAALSDLASTLANSIDNMRQSGTQALAEYGRKIAEAAKQTGRGALAEKGGALVDAANLTKEVFKAVDTGIWDDVGKAAAGIGAAAVAGELAGVAVGAAAAALGILGAPAALAVFAAAAGAAWAADKFLGAPIFQGWKEIGDVIKGLIDDFTDAEDARSPLVLDLDGDGVETLSRATDIYFDHDGNGFAEQTGWVGRDDGLLVWDKNANGQIDSGNELFGNNSVLSNNERAANGFAALADLDGNADGVVDAQDAAFSSLRVWKDVNSDGLVDTGELLTLAQANVVGLNVSYANSSFVDQAGNEHRQVGTYNKVGGGTASMTDVWFDSDPAFSLDKQRVTEPADVQALPDIQGFGNVSSLRQAMAKDSSGQLKVLVGQFATASEGDRQALVVTILYHWAGVQNVDPESRAASQIYGNVIGDARKLATLEHFLARPYLGTWCWGEQDPNPHGVAAPILLKAFDKLAGFVYGQLLLQQPEYKNYLNYITLDETADGMVLNMSGLAAAFEALYTTSSVDAMKTFGDFAAALKNTGEFADEVLSGLRELGDVNGSAFEQAMASLGLASYFGDFLDNSIEVEVGDLDGHLLVGAGGDDHLVGGVGNDTLDGGSGSDYLAGGDGSDTYVFRSGYGVDQIFNSDSDLLSQDVLEFDASVDKDDVIVRRDRFDLVLSVAGTSDSVRVLSYFDQDGLSSQGYALDLVRFVDGTHWSVEDLKAKALVGTAQSEELIGFSSSDTISGLGGADSIYGEDGNDTLLGGDANDSLFGGDGADVLDGGQGDDSLDGGAGSDEYRFVGLNFGQDVIYEDSAVGDTNVVVFSDVQVSQVEVAQNGYDAVILLAGTQNRLTLSFWLGFEPTISTILFADAAWTTEQLTAMSFLGTSGQDWIEATATNHVLGGRGGNDYLLGSAGVDSLDGGTGDDSLEGGAGSDTYVFADGYGQDTITDYDATVGNVDTVLITTLQPNEVVLWRDEYSLHVNLADGSRLTVESFFLGQGSEIERVEIVGGPTWTSATLRAAAFRGTGAADQLYGTTGSDRLDGLGGDDYISGDGGNDTLNGGVGNDQLLGDAGNDTYLFARGDGQDMIIETSGTDTIKFIGGITAADIRVSRDDFNYYFEVVGSADRIAVGSWFDGSAYRIENVAFDDGTTWNASTINSKTTTASQYADFYWGTASANTYDGLAGDDEIYGFAGNDTLSGGDGNDYIDGGEGNDVLNGGAGDDTFVIDSASDSVTEASGQGIDTVKSTVAWTLGANVENLTLLDLGGAISATGNELDNVLVGNSSDNTLTGGAGADQLLGNAGNDTLDGGTGADSLVGGTGNDTYVVDDAGDAVVELAAGGSDTVQSSITYTLGDNVEKLTLIGAAAINGTGNSLNNTLTGNSAANTLTGGAGNDSLNGGAGADTLVGGTGDDTYTVDNAGDVVTELAGEGVDTVRSSVAYTLGSTLENLTLTGSGNIAGTGNTTDNVLTGNTGNNTLTGLGGADVLDGGAGSDTLVGGTGDDIYVVDATTDVVTELTGEGTDTVQTTVTLTTLAANVENLTLLELGGAINGTGNTLDNVITGNTAVNTLNGGAGADTLIGGQGDDIYVVDAGDTVIELDGEGTDTVQSAISWTLGANLEKLTLTGSTAVNATGNDLANTLTGNSAANVLTGGLGDDIYVVGAGDTVVESANEGIDTVQSSLTYTLTANVEKLTLTGSSAINGTGNELDNTLTGNSGANTLTGGLGNDTLNGGTGADSLVGGQGDDTYVIDNTGDAVTESTGEGTDTVQSSITYTLGANVENLTLTGSTALNGTGNELNNLLTGNSGVNTLTGGAGNDTLNGGAGADSLVGGTGDDLYVVDNASDTITENASEGIDTVQSSITFSLASYANVENVTLTGSSALSATGNAADNALTGNSGANTLTGGEGNDTYRGGAGTDTLNDTSTTSNDVYTWGRGEGADTLTDAGGTDRLDILAGAAANQIWLRHVGNNLEVSVIGTSDKFTISGWYTAAANQVESLKLADGRALQAANVQTLVDAMAAFSPPAAGQTTLPSNYDTALSSVIAANWA